MSRFGEEEEMLQCFDCLASPLLCYVSSVYLFIRVAILICEQGSSEVLTQIRPSNSIPLHPLLSSQHFLLLLPAPAPVATVAWPGKDEEISGPRTLAHCNLLCYHVWRRERVKSLLCKGFKPRHPRTGLPVPLAGCLGI